MGTQPPPQKWLNGSRWHLAWGLSPGHIATRLATNACTSVAVDSSPPNTTYLSLLVETARNDTGDVLLEPKLGLTHEPTVSEGHDGLYCMVNSGKRPVR